MRKEIDPNIAHCGPRQAGFTLLEVMVAIVVLSVGTLTVLAAVNQSRLSIGEERLRLLAGVVADNRAEALRLSGNVSTSDTEDMGGIMFTVRHQVRATAAGLSEVTIVARPQSGGPGALRVTWLPARRGGGG